MKQIQGDVNLRNLYLKELPSILTNVSVTGNFSCSDNNLTSLDGAPRSVGGDFDCSNNAIKFTIEQVRAVCDVKGTIRV